MTRRRVEKRIDDPLGYPERNVWARVRHMARDAIAGIHEDAVEREAAVFAQRLREAGKLPRGHT